MSEAKIRLSQNELELITNAGFILTKNAILKKINQLLAGLQFKQKQYIEHCSTWLPDKVFQSTPKISKGENYQGLPYLILDYPKCFEQEYLPDRQSGIFAIRTMFWWGNFFSITLHLSGSYKKEAEEKLIVSYSALKEKQFFFCINNNQWEHHFENSNYILLTELNKVDFENAILDKDFIKLAYKFPLQQWDEAEQILLDCFKEIMEILAD